MSDFLQLSGKTFVVFGVANRKSVAWVIAQSLEEQGARVLYSVRSEARRKSLEALLADRPVFVCDVEQEGAACHEGFRSCFFREMTSSGPQTVLPRLIDPASVYQQ